MDKVFLGVTSVSVVALVTALALATPKVDADKPADGTLLVHVARY